MNWLQKYRSEVISVIAIGAFMTVLAPYDTDRLSIWLRYIYWTGLMAVGWGSAAVIQPLIARWAPEIPVWAYLLCLSLSVSVPVTIGVLLVQSVWGPGFPLQAIPVVFGFVWVISIGVSVIGWLSSRTSERHADSIEPQTASPALLDQLPPGLRSSPILALESEDHYLRVHCEAGNALILMRLRDAIAALPDAAGEQTHRSWWVAKDAVLKVERSQGRAQLTLKNELVAPVSRTFAPRLRDAGWY